MNSSPIEHRRLHGVWRVEDFCFEILSTTKAIFPGLLEELEILDRGCPIAPTVDTFSSDTYLRPEGHSRSFCRIIDGGVLCIKGIEPLCRDFRSYFEKTKRYRKISEPTAFEHFVLLEHEVFLAISIKDALACAHLSLEFARRYHARFDRTPKVPLPLRVYELPDESVRTFLHALEPYLSDRQQISAKAALGDLAKEGLAVYVYAYPGMPIRAAHHRGFFVGRAWGGPSTSESDVKFDRRKAIREWTRLFAEMLALGFLPSTPLHTGNCLQEQNLTIDGGMCDLDSLERIDENMDPIEIERSLIFCVWEFAQSISNVLSGGSLASALAFAAIWRELRSFTETLGIDHRLETILTRDGLEILLASEGKFRLA